MLFPDLHLEESWHLLRRRLHPSHQPIVVGVELFVVVDAEVVQLSLLVVAVAAVVVVVVVAGFEAVGGVLLFVVAVAVVVLVVVVVVVAAAAAAVVVVVVVVVQDVADRVATTLESRAEAGHSHHAKQNKNTKRFNTL